ncbi:MAG: hypothetical protein WC989_03490 [Micavibrio sp.]
MIKTIGIKRAVVLLSLAGLCAFAFVLSNYFLTAQVQKSRQALASTQGEIAQLQMELEQMRQDAIFLEREKGTYENITRLGFFEPQDRVEARARLDTIQKLSKIVSARYEIRAATVMREEDTQTDAIINESLAAEGEKAPEFAVIESPVIVTLSAIDDIDIYNFIYYLNYGYPGHISIEKLNIERRGDITQDNLKLIGMGTPPELVSARMEIIWRSMIPRDVLESSRDMRALSAGVSQ